MTKGPTGGVLPDVRHAGVKVVYDLSQPSQSRVISLEVRCLHCTVPEFSPLDDNATYEVLMMDFTIKGRDGFSVITDNLVERIPLNSLDPEVFATYLRKYNPIYAGVEGRIKFVTPTSVVPATVPPISPTSPTLPPSVSITTSQTAVPVTCNITNNTPNLRICSTRILAVMFCLFV